MPTDVGVRELKRDLSNYLKRAAAGEEIRVTMRGEPIVQLTRVQPVADDEEAAIEALWEAAYASGVVKRAKRPKGPIEMIDLGLTYDPLELILEERENGR